MKKIGMAVSILMSASAVYMIGEDFTILSKNKKKCVSLQQCTELDGEIAFSTNVFAVHCADLSNSILSIQKGSFDRINEQVDGGKIGKIERTERYVKLVRLKEEIDRGIDELLLLKQRLNATAVMVQQQSLVIQVEKSDLPF